MVPNRAMHHILVRTFKSLFQGWSSLVFIDVGTAESNTERYSGSILLSFMIPRHPFTIQKHFIKLKTFFVSHFYLLDLGESLCYQDFQR